MGMAVVVVGGNSFDIGEMGLLSCSAQVACVSLTTAVALVLVRSITVAEAMVSSKEFPG